MNLMKSAERALGSCVTIFKHSYAHLSSRPSNEVCSKETIASTHVTLSNVQCQAVQAVRCITRVEAIVSLEHILFDGHDDKWM